MESLFQTTVLAASIVIIIIVTIGAMALFVKIIRELLKWK